MSYIGNFLDRLLSLVRTIGLSDIVDMVVVAYIVYTALVFIRETRAMQLLKGLVVFMIAYVCASSFELTSLKFLLDIVLQFGVVALVVVFQPELRHALEKLGRTNLSNIKLFGIKNFFGVKNLSEQEVSDVRRGIAAVCDAADMLSYKKTGALIVMENHTKLGEIIATGTQVDAVPSIELFGNLFYVNTPLHDGAVVMREGRIAAAGCILPLSENYEISKEMGTRHRAALGVSENCDAVVVVVSEETGLISIAQGGNIVRGVERDYLQQVLTNELIPAPVKNKEQQAIDLKEKIRRMLQR